VRYALLLRGINVGQKTKVPMADLRETLTGIGLTNVRTLLNSGNALFTSELDEGVLEEEIKRALEDRFQVPIPALVRRAEEIRAVMDGLPFSSEEIECAQASAGDAESLYVAFLSAPLSEEARTRLDALVKPGETVRILGRTLYLLLEHSIRECKVFSGMDRLDSRATVRNFNTVRKMDALMGE
jgi:uncharacterized protein (DUF1697 family)